MFFDLPKIFKTLVSHGIPLEKGQKSYSFLKESEANEPSVLSLEEKEAVKWLLDNPTRKNLVLEQLLRKDILNECFLEVKEPILNKENQKKIGDIDFLSIPFTQPDMAIAIEFKRVKVITQKDGKIKVNKYQSVRKKGIKQIRELRKLGFHQTYLGIIIVDDGRNRKEENTILKYGKGKLIDEIFSITFAPDLNPNAGVFFVIINQPTGENYNLRYNLQVAIARKSKKHFQSQEMTNRIKTFLKNKKTV